MKKNLFTALTLLACFTVSSQEEVKGDVRTKEKQELSPKPTTIKLKEIPTKHVKKSSGMTISKRAGEPQKVHNAAYYQNEISIIDNNIAAIDQKIVAVNSDIQEKQIAESNGWFEDMEKIKIQLDTKKTTLQAKLAEL